MVKEIITLVVVYLIIIGFVLFFGTQAIRTVHIQQQNYYDSLDEALNLLDRTVNDE